MKTGLANNSRRTALVATLGLHALLIAALLSQAPVRSAIATAVPIMVKLIPADPLVAPQVPPKPLPVRRRGEPAQVHPLEPLPLVTNATEAPAPMTAPALAVPPRRSVDPAPRPADSAPAPTAAAAIVAPRFDAAYLQNPAPVYPLIARRMGEQGRVLLRVLVTADGAADRVELRSTSGSERLDRAALDTVKRWRFVPARQGDAPVAAWVLVPISFSLEG